MDLRDRHQFVPVAAGAEGGVLALGLVLAALAGLTPLSTIDWNGRDLAIGLGVAVGLFPLFLSARSLRRQVREILGVPLANCRWWELVLLAALAGLGEELLFRGVLEPWLARWNPLWAALLVNLLFGLLHALSLQYFLAAMAIGLLMSALQQWPGEPNLLRPIIAHGVYDLFGFLWIAAEVRKAQAESPETDSTEEPPPGNQVSD